MLNKQLDKREWIYLLISLILTVAIFARVSTQISSLAQDMLCKFENNSLNCTEKLISFGSKSLIPIKIQDRIIDKENKNKFHRYKQKGIEDFKNTDYAHAAEDFSIAFTKFPEAETLIYKNNAEAATHQPIKIIVSVPIGQELDVAQEILQGVAQAQDEINQNGGINDKWLQVGIADDRNHEDFARKVAKEAIENKNILAVIGHNSSRVSSYIAPEYNKNRLVMITPTGYALSLSQGDYEFIFKVVPDVPILADKLKKYYTQEFPNQKLFICDDRSESVSQDFGSRFSDISTNYNNGCHINQNNFNPATAISNAKKSNANNLLLAASVQKSHSFIDLVKANKNQLSLFSSSSLYTKKTLEQAKKFAKDMVLITPWHPAAFVGNSFAENAEKLWKGQVNWRAAMAYDATKVIIASLKHSNTRQELQAQIKKTQICGATGKISFTPSGERQEKQAFIIKVLEDKDSKTGFDFKLNQAPLNKNCI